MQLSANSFDPSTARFLAEASRAAYLDTKDEVAAALGLTKEQVVMFSAKKPTIDTEGFTARVENAIVLSFRGTENPENWMTDLNATPVRFNWLFPQLPQIGEVHAGFGHALADAWSMIDAAVDEHCHDDSALPPLFITGHSLGGALAVLATAIFELEHDSLHPVAAVYTFGQPRVGNHECAAYIDRTFGTRHFRFINQDDVVPQVPPRGFDYAHSGVTARFDAAGTLNVSAAIATESTTLWQRLHADMDTAKEFFSRPGPEIEFHLMDSKTGYIRTFDAWLASRAAQRPG